jgi:hypothetical protein
MRFGAECRLPGKGGAAGADLPAHLGLGRVRVRAPAHVVEEIPEGHLEREESTSVSRTILRI